MSGGIIIGCDYFGCANISALTDAEASANAVERMVVEAGFSPQARALQKFEPLGFSYVVVLLESHVAVHTWPEYGAAQVTIHVCNYSRDNTGPARRLERLIRGVFAPESVDYDEMIRRGDQG